MKPRKRLGEMLVEAGLLTAEQLERVVASPRPPGLKLGQHLVREGYVRESDLLAMLGEQLRIKQFNPGQYPANPDLASILPPSMAGKHQVVPLERQTNLLIVAMPDPTDIMAMDTVQKHVKTEVEPVICTEAQFNGLMAAIYGVNAGKGIIPDEIEEVDYGSESEADQTDHIEEAEVRHLMDMAEGQTAVRNVNWIITQAVRESASDVHIAPEKNHVQIRLRVDGMLKDLPSLPKSMLSSVVSRLKILGRMDIAITRIPQDGRFTARIGGREINVRVSAIPTIYGENLVLRLLDMNALVFKLGQLGMREHDIRKIDRVIQRPHGMLLNTGPTGSGKSTTLYSILAKLNQPDVNIITVEDPVEYRMARIRQVELNTKAGMTFAGALRSILRQDPDIIMVGEIRDSETATVAIQAALTGHLVLSTVHTNDAVGTITRLVDMGIEPFLISSVLIAVIAQRLVRRVCPNCAEPWKPSPEALEFCGMRSDPEARFMKAKGCYHCRQTGYRGRLGLYEVLLIDETIQDLILHRSSEAKLREAARANKQFTTLKEDAAWKVKNGMTTLEEAAAAIVL